MGLFLNILLIILIAVAFGTIADLFKKIYKRVLDKFKKNKE
jgi:hypothetical protein